MSLQFPDIDPSQSTAKRVRADIIETRFGNGRSQRLARYGGGYLEVEWDLLFAHRPIAEIAQIDEFLAARAGVEAFIWAPPANASGMFVCASWLVTPTNASLASLRARFVGKSMGNSS
jgi:phage-related protein